MSFGGGSFGSGFGQSNQQSGGFTGFGSSTNNTTGFGANTTNNAFGTANANTGGGLFGGNTGGGFGSTGSAFGSSSNNNTFGSKPAFGAATTTSGGGGLFGSTNNNQSSNTFGGFGNTGSTTFGSSSTNTNTAGGGLFSANKPAFGTTNTGTSLFGGNTSSGFGSNTTGSFGAANNPGIGANVGDPPGTSITPFQAHVEKEPNSTGNQQFQNILFQEPYRKWSEEELRLADYVQGRRHGNASGAGAFGVSSGFGGGFGTTSNPTPAFGGGTTTTSGSLFGSSSNNTSSNNNNSGTGSAFGQTGNTAFGGGTTGGSLFGNKPATTGGLFGNTTQPAQAGGASLFGSGTGGFGSNTSTGNTFGTTGNATSGGLFGSNNAATQNKPGGFSFGTPSTTGGFGATGTSTGFGTANNTNTGGTGLFSNTTQSTGTGLFGNTNPQQQGAGTGGAFGSGGFGSQNQQTGAGLFGNTQSKPGGLFGNPNTSTGGMFNTQTSTTPFGANTAGASSTSLFGNKPATAGTGIFGPANTAQNTANTGNLFGGLGSSTQAQQTGQPNGLFGSLGQNQQKQSLFPTSTQPATGLFGNPPAQQQSSIFGHPSTQQQPQNSGLGNPVLGGSLGIGSTPQSLATNIGDVSAYGTPSLFSNLGGGEVTNPGPLATPLSNKTKPRRSSILPMYKLNPASASRFVTPQKRGFGFSYSTYGTPGSPASAASTPGGFGRSLLGSGSLGRSLNKSVSTNSLRRNFNAEDSILAPGAFSASSGARYYGGNGSSKKLVINRDMRSDLFSTPQKEKPLIELPNGSGKLTKRVSFDKSLESNKNGDGETSSHSTNHSGDVNGHKAVSSGSPPEVDSAKGKELAVVEEEPSSQTPRAGTSDKALGEWYMSPSREAIESMTRQQREKVPNFTVGMSHVGWVKFKVPVDLTEPSVRLDDLFGKIVQFRVRAATVYPEVSQKPPVGKGLNVPAIISLEQSGPRGKVTPERLAKHIERLKRIPDTTFESFDQDTGTWTFSVEHFTTYGLEDEDDTDVEPRSVNGGVSAHSDIDGLPFSDYQHSSVRGSGPDDTFDFRRKGLAVPGAFDLEDVADVSDGDEMVEVSGNGRSLIRFGQSNSPQEVIPSAEEEDLDGMEGGSDVFEEDGSVMDDGHSMVQDNDLPVDDSESQVHETPGGILRARMRAIKSSATPMRLQVADGDDWMAVLQKSVNRARPDRATLKAINEESMDNKDVGLTGKALTERRVAADGPGFATSIDLMNSLFGKPKTPADPVPSKSNSKWPHDRRDKLQPDYKNAQNEDFRFPPRPSWGPNGELVLVTSRPDAEANPFVKIHKTAIQSEEQCLQFGSINYESPTKGLWRLFPSKDGGRGPVSGIPHAQAQRNLVAGRIYHELHDAAAIGIKSPENIEEDLAWKLTSILYEPLEAETGVPEHATRRANLSKFWEDLVEKSTSQAISFAKSPEEKALAALSGHRLQEACKHLLDGKNFRLATLVSLINTSETSKKDMRAQLKEWRDANVLSEFSDTIRAIYELLSGNACVCEGKKNVPVEDRMDSFVISKRFGLDWKRAFGLRLWYSLPPDGDISGAIKLFEEDIRQDREQRPPPWYMDGSKDIAELSGSNKPEHLLWGLLKLYVDGLADLEAVLRPTNWGRNPFDVRLSWQLGRRLVDTGKVSYGSQAAEKADAATISYASQLTRGNDWTIAPYVLLFLSDQRGRDRALRDFLSRRAAQLPPGSTTSAAFRDLGIPDSYVLEAQALFLRTLQRHPETEILCLLRAGQSREAHRRLIEQVAPASIVSRDYGTLLKLFADFEGREKEIPEWDIWARVFKSFLMVVTDKDRKRTPGDADLTAMLAGFQGMTEGQLFNGGNALFRAAVMEMASEAGTRLMGARGPDLDATEFSKVLALPLTDDARLRLTARYSELLV